jgi:hypothetical protein
MKTGKKIYEEIKEYMQYYRDKKIDKEDLAKELDRRYEEVR